MPQTKLAEQLQTKANISVIRLAWNRIKARERRDIQLTHAEDAKVLDFDKECYNYG